MDINEITIFPEIMPLFDNIIKQVSKIINTENEKLTLKLETIDDWNFTNEQPIHHFKSEILNEKIILCDLELRESHERVAHIQIEKNKYYRIDIYFDNNINEMISIKLFDEFVNIMNYNFKFITFGDDYLLEFSQDIDYLIQHSTSIKYWIIPQMEKKYSVITIKNI